MNNEVPGAAGAPYLEMPRIASIGTRIGKNMDVPDSVKGPVIDAAKAYRLQQVRRGLYMITDDVYKSMFMTYENSVVVVVAPPSYAVHIHQTIAGVTDKPITHTIDCHSHIDHEGSTRAVGWNPVITAQRKPSGYLIGRTTPTGRCQR